MNSVRLIIKLEILTCSNELNVRVGGVIIPKGWKTQIHFPSILQLAKKGSGLAALGSNVLTLIAAGV